MQSGLVIRTALYRSLSNDYTRTKTIQSLSDHLGWAGGVAVGEFAGGVCAGLVFDGADRVGSSAGAGDGDFDAPADRAGAVCRGAGGPVESSGGDDDGGQCERGRDAGGGCTVCVQRDRGVAYLCVDVHSVDCGRVSLARDAGDDAVDGSRTASGAGERVKPESVWAGGDHCAAGRGVVAGSAADGRDCGD